MLSIFCRTASRRVAPSAVSCQSLSAVRLGHGHSHAEPPKAGSIPSGVQGDDAFQATGLEKLELEGEKSGKPLFDSVMRGPFGTKDHPVLVKSRNHERIVGCPGNCADPKEDGELMWWALKKGQDFTCPECSQVFRLVDDGSHEHAHH